MRKLTERVDGELRFRSVPPLLVPLRELLDAERRARRGRLTSASCSTSTRTASTPTGATCSAPTSSSTWRARWSASAASAPAPGSSCFVGRGGRRSRWSCRRRRPQASVLEPYLGASEYANHGERVVRGQRMSHAATDIFLSWQRSDGPRRPGARLLRAPALGLEGVGRPVDDDARRACTPTRAPAGGRWRARTRAPATAWRLPPTSGAGSGFDRRSPASRRAYADQNERDHERLAEAVGDGEVAAEHGV